MTGRVLWRPLLGLLAVGLLVVFGAAPGAAYGGGPANWQIGVSGTATQPGTGIGFGFWGWCVFAGGVTSGNDGDCEVADYLHLPRGGGATCERRIDISSWVIQQGSAVPLPTFFITGTATSRPATPDCLRSFPPSFTGFDTMFPGAAGHYSLASVFVPPGFVGELQIQVTQIPH
jgi:hypothetical protein